MQDVMGCMGRTSQEIIVLVFFFFYFLHLGLGLRELKMDAADSKYKPDLVSYA